MQNRLSRLVLTMRDDLTKCDVCSFYLDMNERLYIIFQGYGSEKILRSESCENRNIQEIHIYFSRAHNIRKYYTALAVNVKVLLHTLIISNNIRFKNFFTLYHITLL